MLQPGSGFEWGEVPELGVFAEPGAVVLDLDEAEDVGAGSLAANIRADAEGRYDSAEPGWRSGVEWTLLWIENTAAQLTQSGGVDGRQGVSPE